MICMIVGVSDRMEFVAVTNSLYSVFFAGQFVFVCFIMQHNQLQLCVMKSLQLFVRIKCLTKMIV